MSYLNSYQKGAIFNQRHKLFYTTEKTGTLFPWAELDFEFNNTDELLKGISERYDLENAKQGDLCRILSLLVQGGAITKTDYWDGQAIVPVAGTGENFPFPKEPENLVRDYYDNFEEFVDQYGVSYSENVRERLQMSLGTQKNRFDFPADSGVQI